MGTDANSTARNVKLASGFTVGNYLDLADSRESRDLAAIAEAIHRRFVERYLEPVTGQAKRHGFTMIAISCLMIEAFQSFRMGWADTSQRNQGAYAFCSFFDSEDLFAPFRGHSGDFYKGVRCGILHQAETTLGWRIRQDGDLLALNSGVRTINAKKFVIALQKVLDRYRDTLRSAPWDDELWVRLRNKMKYVCANCEARGPASPQR
jgi:hypothetical protein